MMEQGVKLILAVYKALNHGTLFIPLHMSLQMCPLDVAYLVYVSSFILLLYMSYISYLVVNLLKLHTKSSENPGAIK